MTGSSAAPERSGFAFSDETWHRIFSEYVSFLLKACDVFRVPYKHLVPTSPAPARPSTA